jgi:hypothetical protein
LEHWTWEEILDGKGPWAKPGEYRRPKAELEAAKAERRRYEEAAWQRGWKPERQPPKYFGRGRHTGSVTKSGRRTEPGILCLPESERDWAGTVLCGGAHGVPGACAKPGVVHSSYSYWPG